MADKSEVIQDYLNSLNEAMAIHAKKAVEGLEFDRTELAEIVDITNRDKGQYQVFNGSVRYYAYSENTSYTLGSKVYVTIPNNDYSQQKLIKGKYKSKDEDTGIAWVSPLQNYQALTDNLIEDESAKNKKEWNFSNSSIGLENIPANKNYDNTIGLSLLANYNKVLKAQSEETDNSSQYASQYIVLYQSEWMREDSPYNKNYEYMGLSADFKTTLSGFYPVSGSYGLMIILDYSIKLSGEEPLVHKTKICKLDSSTMIGSIYNFNTFYKQEALFKLDNNPEHGMQINQVTVLFYQDGEFRNNNNELISPLYNDQLLPDNIFVKNIGVWFGDEIEEDDEDVAEIYTLNGEMYDSAQTNDKLNEKRIHLKWLHVNPIQEEQSDGTKKWIKDLMDSSNLNNIPSSADVKLIANIHWYSDAQYTIETYRTNLAKSAAVNDHLFEVTEKWKYAPNSLTEEDIKTLVEGTNWSPKKDYEYYWDENEQRYIFTVTASGEKVLERTITRNGKEDKTTTVNDELAGSGWIPIKNSWNKFEIDFQPDNERQYTHVKCIIEVGPELLVEDEETGKMTKTGLVNPNSSYRFVLETNTITFKNLSWVPDIATHDIANGITITVNDKTDGHYPIYNATDGRILTRAERDRIRSLKADILSTYTGNSLLNGNEIILWQIPKTNTMIDIEGTLSKSRLEVISKDSGYLYSMNEQDIIQANVQASLDEFITKKNEIAEKYQADIEQYTEQTDKLVENLNIKLNELIKERNDILSDTVEEYHNKVEYYANMRTDILNVWQYQYDEWIKNGNPDNTFDATSYKEALDNTMDMWNSATEEIEHRIQELTLSYDEKIEQVYEELKNTQNLSEKWKSEISQAYDEVVQKSQEHNQAIAQAATVEFDLSNWFDKNNMDFDNYYYLVRFGSDLAGVNPYQLFQIKEYYTRTATNNTIFCYIVKNNKIFKGQIILTFSQHGSSGTDYTFTLGLGELIEMPPGVTMGSDNNAVDTTNANWEDYVIGSATSAITIGETAFHRIRFELYDAENNLIDLTNEEKNAIISKWVVSRLQDGYYSGYNSAAGRKDGNAKNLQFLVKRIKENNVWYYTDIAVRAPQANITNYRYIILSAAVRHGATATYNDDSYALGPVNFIQMLPLHFRTNNQYNLDGADYITYDDKGSNPQSYSNKYDLIDITNETFKLIVNGDDVSQVSSGSPKYKTIYKYYPHLDENNKLVPCVIYVSDLDRKIAVEASINNNTVYTMPLLMIQNRYQIPAINSWNGELLIDEKNNRVMAATIAAGRKDQNNRFTGVIMGDVGKTDSSSGRVQTISGLYGYHTGEEAFGFLSNGTGFIGKSGTGRIEFNGKDGWIQSANYSVAADNAKSGTRIDLNDGSIDMWGRGVTYKYDPDNNTYIKDSGTESDSTNVHLDVEGSTSKPYFKIEVPRYTTVVDNNGNVTSTATTERQALIRIDKSQFYLQTADYNEQTNTGLKIDLKRGIFDSKGKLTINGAKGSKIHFGDNTNYLEIGYKNSEKGYLKSTGRLDITGDSESIIKFGNATNGYRFKVNGSNGKVTLCSLDFVDDNGSVKNGGNATIATNIKPKWMTFVTDVSGTVSRSTVSVTASISNTVTVPYSYSYPVKEIEKKSASAVIYTGNITQSGTTSNMDIDYMADTLSPYGPYYALVTASYPVVTKEYTRTENKSVTVPYTATWTGMSDVPYVNSINLTIERVSMWALTNDTASPSSRTIS